VPTIAWPQCDASSVDIKNIYSGQCVVYAPLSPTRQLIDFALSLVKQHALPALEIDSSESSVREFVDAARRIKSEFTNSDLTRQILEKLIFERYSNYVEYSLSYDLPRLRIIPNSSILSSGISYNYKPHRDTWYGADQDQINHWIAVENVTSDSTFFIAPSFFDKSVENTSSKFDLDVWDAQFRYKASSSIKREEREHPIPLQALQNTSMLPCAIPPSHEICFSGHHLHGSLPNTTDQTRLSIDYRVIVSGFDGLYPNNIDSESRGEYSKFLKPHPSFSAN